VVPDHIEGHLAVQRRAVPAVVLVMHGLL
jgi:hypothetical protein